MYVYLVIECIPSFIYFQTGEVQVLICMCVQPNILVLPVHCSHRGKVQKCYSFIRSKGRLLKRFQISDQSSSSISKIFFPAILTRSFFFKSINRDFAFFCPFRH